MLDPQVKLLLEAMAARGLPPVYTMTPQQARESYVLRKALTQPAPPEVGQVRDHALAGAGKTIAVREYRPAGAGAAALPALVYLHGGGWTIGNIESHDVLCRMLCNGAGCAVFSVDYRLAPESPFPAAYEDAREAFLWVAAHGAQLGIDPERLAIGGDSAGGNLAAAVCLGLVQAPQRPSYQLLIYPATDQRAVAPSHAANGQGYWLTSEAIEWFRGHYLPDERDYTDWRASPLLARSHAGLPPAFVLTAGLDPLRDEGLQYADALSEAGVAAEYVCFDRQIHGFITMGLVLREAATAVELCSAALRRALAA